MSQQQTERRFSQKVDVNRAAVPPHLKRLAAVSRSANVDEPQPAPTSLERTLAEQEQFNCRAADERARAANVTLDEVRQLHRHQNALFRPTARIGHERRSSDATMADDGGNNIGATSVYHLATALEDGNLPVSEVLCALDKQERVRAEVDRRIVEAKAAGFGGNRALERARALRTGTLVPRKSSIGGGGGSALLVGNNNPGMSGGRSSGASYEVGVNESNNFLRRMTGVEFEGEKCQRMARKERALLAPQPMAEPPPGYLPGGGHFLSERERLDYTFDNPHLAGQYVKPQKPINPNQWTDRPVSYRPPIRYNLADEIPFEEPHNRGVFVQPEPVGSRVSSDESVPYRNMPGDSFGAVEELQVRAPRDESRLEKYRRPVGPLEPPLPFAAAYDDNPVAHDDRLPSYATVKPKLEREHLAQGSTDSIARGISLVDESAQFDPAALAPLGVRTGDAEREQRARQAAGASSDAAAQQFQAARLMGDNETFTAGTMVHDVSGAKAATKGSQRTATATEAHVQSSDFHSRLAIGGDPSMFEDNAVGTALAERQSAPRDASVYLREKLRERQSLAGKAGDNAAALDGALLVDVGHASVAAPPSQEATQRATTLEKLALLRARMAARRANAYDDNLLFDDTNCSRTAIDALTASSVSERKRVDRDRAQTQRNFERVRDAMQRVRLTMTDGDDGTQDYGAAADRVVQQVLATAANQQTLSNKTRQLEQKMMANGNGSGAAVLLDESRFIDVRSNGAAGATATQAHREQGAEGARLRKQQTATLQNARLALDRAPTVSDDQAFADSAERVAGSLLSVRAVDTADSVVAQRARASERATVAQARYQLQRQSAFDDVEPQATGRVQEAVATRLRDERKEAQRERDALQTRTTSLVDISLYGDNCATRAASDGMAVRNADAERRGAIRGADSMQAAAAKVQAQNFGSALDLQRAPLTTTQQDIRAIDTKRQALIDKQIMAEHNTRLTALDETNTASHYQEDMIAGGRGGEVAERARAKGADRERVMLAADAERRQALRPSDTEMFEHHTIDSGVGSEPRGGQAAFDRRADRREVLVQDVPRVAYDAVDDYLTVDHVLQRLEATRCDKPSAVLYAQRQAAHEQEIARLERGPPSHLLPAYMLPGGKKQVTPRGSPTASPRASPVPH